MTTEGGAGVQVPNAAARVEPWNVGENEADQQSLFLASKTTMSLRSPEISERRAPTEAAKRTQKTMARGTGAQHQHRRRKRQVGQEQGGPRFFSGFHFLSTNEGSILMLAVGFSRLEVLQATVLSREDNDRIGSEILCEVHRQNKHQEIHSVNEPSILALKDAEPRSPLLCRDNS